MRLLGIDFGTRKVGFALSDAQVNFAFPHMVVKREDALKAAEDVCKAHEVTAIVVGESRDLSGTPNPVQVSIRTFSESLRRRTGLPLYFEPEQFSTQEARRSGGSDDSLVDASAAAIILRNFIEKHRRELTE